jgi:hypothetical protein
LWLAAPHLRRNQRQPCGIRNRNRLFQPYSAWVIYTAVIENA